MESIRQQSLRFQGWYLGLQWLSFRWRFMDQQWDRVCDNSMRQPWLYFCYLLDLSVMNSFTLSIPYVSCHSVFCDDYKVYNESVFTDDLWISSDIIFLTIPLRQPWLFFCYRFDASVVNSLTLWISHVNCHSVFGDDFLVYSDSGFANYLWISSDITFFTIPCISHDSIFAIDFIRRSWIHWRYGFHTSAVT
jgi:hypothetical protein